MESGSRRGFWSLIVTQFQGAFSDNALKFLVTLLAVGATASVAERHRQGELIGALFSLPFILFSMAGGQLADRYSKRAVTIGVKCFELGIMTLATFGFLSGRITIGLACVFLMGVHSAFFGPSKYGLLPELLSESQLSWGNGILELGTFLAIILGMVAGGIMAGVFHGQQVWSGLVLLLLAGAGLGTAFGISRVSAAAPGRPFRLNFLGELVGQIRAIRADRPLWLAVVGNTYFTFVGALLQLNIIFYGLDTLHVTETQTSYLLVALAIGIGLGSFAAGSLSGDKIETGLIPLGSIGLTLFGLLLARPHLSFATATTYLALLGFFGGFFIVPISAIMQHRPARDRKGGVLATANWLSFVGVFLASGAHGLLTMTLHLDPPAFFLVGGVVTFVGMVYVVWLLPDSLLRFLVWLLTHSIYRIRVEGREHIPEKGGALIVCNHVSFVDALLLTASTDRLLRAIMFKDIYENPIIKPVAKIMHAIPISSQQRPREMIRSLRQATEALKQGHVVVIFAEGQITRIGQMLPFRRGFEFIMKDPALRTTPIIPVALDNVWGSIFSFERGRFFGKIPRYFPYPVTVSYGPPLPATATPTEIRQVVQDLNSAAWRHRKRLMLSLPVFFIRTAHRHPRLFAMADQSVPRLGFGGVLLRTLYLVGRLRRVWQDQKMVGILLPPSVAGALVNYAALLLGKVPVNLNYTVSAETLRTCAEQCQLRTVITSRKFLEKVKLEVPGNAILLEDLAAHPRLTEKLRALALWPIPAPWLARWLRTTDSGPLDQARGLRDAVPPAAANDSQGGSPPTATAARQPLDELATIIFSSGSTGTPKGVMLTQYNLISNVEQLGQTFAFRHQDKLLGVLPFFHSFGFTVTLCLPPVLGMGVVFHPNPLDGKAIGELVAKYRVTFLLATPTFLQLYMRSCEAGQFGSLQYVVTGAEKLPERIAQAFEDQFGIRPLEGYGATECSPVVAVNTRDFRAPGMRQVGAKRGKIGHPLPGMGVRIVDPDTFAPLPIGTPGMLLVCGPNVMAGYLGAPAKTAEVIRDGWYVTGDIAMLDEDGFLTITDRLSRFSKIGGEMVPHLKIEDKLHELAGATEQCFAVTGVPDEKKGERLAVLHTLPDSKLKPVLDALAASDMPNLWKPKPEQFRHVAALPYLGTGKLDLRKIRDLAQSAL